MPFTVPAWTSLPEAQARSQHPYQRGSQALALDEHIAPAGMTHRGEAHFPATSATGFRHLHAFPRTITKRVCEAVSQALDLDETCSRRHGPKLVVPFPGLLGRGVS